MENKNTAVVKSFLDALFSGGTAEASEILADNLKVDNFFPHQSSKKAFLRAFQQVLKAMEGVQVQLNALQGTENMVTAGFQVSGIHAQPLDFAFMKLPVVQPTHKTVAWPALHWDFTISNGKIVNIRNTASLQKGMPGILKSFGVKMPAAHKFGSVLKALAPAGKLKTNPKRFLRFLPLIPLTVILTTIFFVPSPINAAAWTPQPVPQAKGPLTTNYELTEKGELLGASQLQHAEDLAFDMDGRIYAGSDDGNIYRLTLDPAGQVSQFEAFATTGGFPLGLQFDGSGQLIVAVKDIGLMSISKDGTAALLTDQVEGTPITYANAIAINADGLIYFTDSSTKFDRGWPYDVLEARPHGRLLSYDPETGESSLIKDGLYFANGIFLAPDESYLLINESSRARISRYWLTGNQAGELDTFAENLPLLPDNISVDENGNYLLGGMRRLPMMDKLQPNDWLKNQIAKLPLPMLSKFPSLKMNRYGMILILDQNGKIKESLQDPTGKIFAISSARAYDGYIYISTLLGSDIARYPYHR
ncbi:MAG TPA: SMP-30/gluconolactonase/LRE family protein [Anaerolineales bacterium]|nr:SMP-30/gluconolactonase/LRE family protein [Anaerolineales bacterium]